MEIGKVTIRFPEGDEPRGRAPRIMIYAEGRMGNVIDAIFLVLPFVIAILVPLAAPGAPWWMYVAFAVSIIGLGVGKALEAKAYAKARQRRNDS